MRLYPTIFMPVSYYRGLHTVCTYIHICTGLFCLLAGLFCLSVIETLSVCVQLYPCFLLYLYATTSISVRQRYHMPLYASVCLCMPSDAGPRQLVTLTVAGGDDVFEGAHVELRLALEHEDVLERTHSHFRRLPRHV